MIFTPFTISSGGKNLAFLVGLGYLMGVVDFLTGKLFLKRRGRVDLIGTVWALVGVSGTAGTAGWVNGTGTWVGTAGTAVWVNGVGTWVDKALGIIL